MRRRAGSRGLTVLCAVVALTGCSVVKEVRIRDDYATVDQTRTKRLVVVTAPLPDGNAKVGELWSLLSQRYINLHRDFLVKKRTSSADAVVDPKSQCGEGLEGVLWLKPDVKRDGDSVDAAVDAKLLRCADGEEVWGSKAKGSFASRDPHLAETTTQYVGTLGEEVRPYVAPSFLLLRSTFNTLPQPILNDEDTSEKIELEE
ncbi:MAG: MXAN_6521/LA_1396 family lipoprotein [Myxococcaceae bacterium]